MVALLRILSALPRFLGPDALEMASQSSASACDSRSSSAGSAAVGLALVRTVSRGNKRIPEMSSQMATFSLGDRSRGKRTFTAKVKSGCITCKRRHVKCDETRPFCLKCTKSPRGPGVCEGYPSEQKRANHCAPIVPKGTRRPLAALIEPGYETSLFTGPERGYFEFWLRLIGSIYLFPNDIMHRVVPQLARQEPAIKHAALAMAGMARALVPSLVYRSDKELHSNGPHYEFALQHYGRAMKLLRSSQPTSENMLWAIICCVLFITFECLHGDRTAALSHVNHAYKMMEAYFRRRSLVEEGPVTESIRAVCDDAAWVFQGLTMQAWSHNVLHPDNLLEISWCCRGSKRAFAVDEMPPIFTDIHTARRWWRVVQHHTCHRCPIYTEVYVDGFSEDMLAGAYERPALLPTHLETMAAVAPEFLNHLRKWSNAFQALYNDLQLQQHLSEAEYQLYVNACNLRLQYLLLWSHVSSLSFTDTRTVIILTPSFREIVQLSRIVLKAQANCRGCSDTFSMDNGPTWALLVTSCRCRDTKVRQEATGLLGKFNRRDGVWDSRMFHALAKRYEKIETENLLSEDEDEKESPLRRRELRFSRDGNMSGTHFEWDPLNSQWLRIREVF
ncbi:uncharacterized protein LY79DRAFT_564892 [Colletotrichum navitas]|uniref:Zn(2)-C6 fungal-type domain-containing protein n=1 Tax=Colletotrichum navitas TaxID=681940 RepID=A0AAD8V1X1_9PEZI|nr:uncharacterized protein LY79DRAFT_564892 [Colletotrichum navitas]KAK1579143.1 hypothetical protein LY79DRAFT_564892 [Colletotrichum navitas]